ncbi:MAG: hypothetical protein IKQ29_00105 [Bacilli bacterium]|nr:hypothetical protein [Bacilli bacterium]
MKRVLLLFLLFIPFIVYADDSCSSDSVKIESVKLENVGGSAIDNGDANVEGNSLNINLKVKEVGDNAKYKLVLKNTASDDYEIDKDNLLINTDYMNYEIVTDDDSNIIKAGEEKVVYLVAKYANAVPDSVVANGVYNDNQKMVVNLSNDKSLIKAIEENPYTSTGIMLVVVLIVSGLVILSIKKVKVRKYMILIIPVLLLIPYSVYALCKCELKVEANVEIEKKYTGTIYRDDTAILRNGSALSVHEEDIWCIVEEDATECEYNTFLSEEECENALSERTDPNGYTCISDKVSVGTDDYKLTNDGFEYMIYLKHDINNGIVEKTYVCFKDGDREFCILDDRSDDQNFFNNGDALIDMYNTYYDGYCRYDNETDKTNGTGSFECIISDYSVVLEGQQGHNRFDSYYFSTGIGYSANRFYCKSQMTGSLCGIAQGK